MERSQKTAVFMSSFERNPFHYSSGLDSETNERLNSFNLNWYQFVTYFELQNSLILVSVGQQSIKFTDILIWILFARTHFKVSSARCWLFSWCFGVLMNVWPLRFGSNLTNETDCHTEWARVKRVYGSSPYTFALALRTLTATLILIGIAIEVCSPWSRAPSVQNWKIKS